jgi:hypothetical protein
VSDENPAAKDPEATEDGPQESEPEPTPPGKAAPPSGSARIKAWLTPETRSRRILIGLGIYAAVVLVFGIVAGERMWTHTSYNHFAHLADAWLHGRQDIVHGGPAYAGGNDFADFHGKTYISFPPFPAFLMLPLVAVAGSPEDFRDGQFVVWLAGVGPAFLFLALEKLRRTGRSERTETENVLLALVFAFGTVFFFTAVQGTVWFAGHVVGVGLLCAYLLVALDAEHPLIAGALIGCAFLTRPTSSYAALLFGLEAVRVSCKNMPTEGSFLARLDAVVRRIDKPAFFRRMTLFAVPVLIGLGLASYTNYTRFGTMNPTAFGHEHLTVQWHGRIEKWGLFGLHYLPKNLGCMLTILPWPRAHGAEGEAPFRINEHGLALWFTTPLYLWLLRPKKTGFLHGALLASAVLPLVQNLLYQNSGWQQFGYRFSNDYAPLLFLLLAVGARPMGNAWKVAAIWAIGWNTFGALSFGRANFERYYFREGSQTVIYQPD